MQVYEYEKDLTKFDEICEDLKTCKFIVAEIRIMKLLKCISDSDVLYNELEKSLTDFNFEYEFQKAKVPIAESVGNKFNLVLPVEPSKIVALTFRILYEIDSKRWDLQQFINEFYNDDDMPLDSYKKFANHLIVQFQANFEYLITGFQRLEETPVVAYGENLKIEDRVVIDIIELTKKINQIVTENQFKVGQKEEIIIVLNGFVNAMLTRKAEHILVAWVGFKNTIKEFKLAVPLMKKIETKLKNSGIFNV